MQNHWLRKLVEVFQRVAPDALEFFVESSIRQSRVVRRVTPGNVPHLEAGIPICL